MVKNTSMIQCQQYYIAILFKYCKINIISFISIKYTFDISYIPKSNRTQLLIDCDKNILKQS